MCWQFCRANSPAWGAQRSSVQGILGLCCLLSASNFTAKSCALLVIFDLTFKRTLHGQVRMGRLSAILSEGCQGSCLLSAGTLNANGLSLCL